MRGSVAVGEDSGPSASICSDCYTAGFDPGTGRPLPGRGALMSPTPCAACGLSVVRNADPLLKRVTCSPSCATSLTRSRNGEGRGRWTRAPDVGSRSRRAGPTPGSVDPPVDSGIPEARQGFSTVAVTRDP